MEIPKWEAGKRLHTGRSRNDQVALDMKLYTRKEIKEMEVPKITDALVEIEDSFVEKDYKTLKQKIASLELQIAYVKTKSNFLLDEIKEITLSEEKNRETITKLKAVILKLSLLL